MIKDEADTIMTSEVNRLKSNDRRSNNGDEEAEQEHLFRQKDRGNGEGNYGTSGMLDKTGVTEYETMAKGQTVHWKSIFAAEIIVVFYALSYSVVSFTIDQFLRERFAGEYGGLNDTNSSLFSVCMADQRDPAYVNETKIQQRTSEWDLYLNLAEGIPTTIMSLFFGAYSDYVGRKLLFLLPMIASGVQSLIYTLVSYFHGSLYFLFIGHVLSGLSGGFVTVLLAGYALTSDGSIGNTRSFHIAVLESMGSIMIGVSVLTTGYIIKYLGYTMPFLISTCLALVNTGFIICFIKERVRSHVTRPAFTKLLYNVLQFYTVNRGGMRIVFIMCFTIEALFLFSLFGEVNIISVFLLGQPVCWDSVHIGLFVAALAIAKALGSLKFLKVAQRCLTDVQIATISSVSFALELIFIGLLTRDAFYYAAILLGSIGLSTSPLLRSALSKLTPSGQYGAMFASLASLESFVTLVSGITGNAIYQETVAVYSGAVFMLFAVIMGLAILLFIVLEVILRRRKLYQFITFTSASAAS